jgi:hypothetical protein
MQAFEHVVLDPVLDETTLRNRNDRIQPGVVGTTRLESRLAHEVGVTKLRAPARSIETGRFRQESAMIAGWLQLQRLRFRICRNGAGVET